MYLLQTKTYNTEVTLLSVGYLLHALDTGHKLYESVLATPSKAISGFYLTQKFGIRHPLPNNWKQSLTFSKGRHVYMLQQE